MRTIEAHQDGPLHWSLMVFVRDSAHVKLSRAAINRHFLLNDLSDEPDTWIHRIRFEHVKSAKGGATDYIAKSISKHIDEKGIEHDLPAVPVCCRDIAALFGCERAREARVSRAARTK
ncbi:hypothetical protein WS69_01310 [Burkholderia sp. BDU5]|nr:hypothetical protein WS69_01310 [Burkholderia sp. BDU5]